MDPITSRKVIAAHLAALASAGALAALTAGSADWDPALLAVLLAFSVLSDLRGSSIGAAKIKISGSFLALVLAMVLLGGSPAALIGAATIGIGWFRTRERPHFLANNLAAYAWFPLLGGLLFDAVRDGAGLDRSDGYLYLLVMGVFMFALALNFALVAGYACLVERSSFIAKTRAALVPVLPSELSAALLAVGISYLYLRVGLAAIALFGIVLFTFQYLLGQLLLSEERAEELKHRNTQLASLQMGLISALLHTLDARDRMTARHSAAVARYAREIARVSGFSERDQELVHTAALLHDIGKFVFPDNILKADVPLTEDDWEVIRMHPHEGARIAAQIEGYGPVSDIILAHHERLDGLGYPHGLRGDEIPALSRIISVADAYDVMTSRDSYREPVASDEALAELGRVAGSQLDPRFVESFVELVTGNDVRFRHGEDADFDAELQLERRVAEYAFGAV